MRYPISPILYIYIYIYIPMKGLCRVPQTSFPHSLLKPRVKRGLCCLSQAWACLESFEGSIRVCGFRRLRGFRVCGSGFGFGPEDFYCFGCRVEG